MFYAIDNDTLTVESISEKGEDLASYIMDNELDLAVTLIDNEDELCLNFTLKEMTGLYNNLMKLDELEFKPVNFVNEEDAAEACMGLLNEHESIFPKFTKSLGKKLLKTSSPDTKVKSNTKAKQSTKSSPRVKITLNYDDTLTVVDGKCKSGSILDTIVTAIDDELCDTISEVVDYIISNHVIPKTGELADVKFAEHNIKYFLKQGKLTTGEEL